MKDYKKLFSNFWGYADQHTPNCWGCSNKKAVDIHHLIGRKMGGDPQNKTNRISNLIPLCRSCHTRTEVEKAIQKGGAILTLTETNEKMFLSVEQLESALLTKTKKIIPPRFKGEKPFRLCNVFWKNKENKDQGSFFDQQLNKIKMEIK